jgi:hypothetical protein
MSADQYHPIPPGCPTDYVRPRQGPYRPLFFSEAEFTFTCCFTRLVLGDAPQDVTEEVAEWVDLRIASDAGVRRAESRVEPLYHALASAYFGSNQGSPVAPELGQTFRNGLAWISDSAQSQYGKQFLSLDPEQQVKILHAISDGREDPSVKNPGTELFAFLKTEVTKGFYTSRFGLTELNYKGNAFYARSPGCSSK